jgi:endonuclease G
MKKKKQVKRHSKGKKGKKASPSPIRRIVRNIAIAIATVFAVLCAAGAWYASHSAEWLAEKNASLPRFVSAPLLYFGDRTIYLTDGLGITGHDVVYDFDEPPPEGRVFFAGAPVRTGSPAPTDITVLDRGEFAVGWSPSLGHAVWAAYHIPREARFESDKRPSFRKDPDVPASPSAAAYTQTGYDRGHLAPNHAIESRFGPDVQRKTFYTTNIAPQRPALNRGAWRQVERLAADLWTAKYGELWMLVGTISKPRGESGERLAGTTIDVPEAFWTVIVAQTDDGVRALALVLPQTIEWDAFPVHGIVSINDVERLSGLNLLPELPSFIAKPLEAERPTRLWPVRLRDIFSLIALRFNNS